MNNFSGTPAEFYKDNKDKIINLRDFREKRASSIVSDWQPLIKKEIDDIGISEEDDILVSDLIKENAKLFVDKLPYPIKSPSLGIEPNGAILLEWIDKTKEGNGVSMFSVIIDEERMIYSTFNVGEIDSFRKTGARGVAYLTDLSIESSILTILKKYFSNDVMHAQRQRHSL